jgi:hypothetical protein
MSVQVFKLDCNLLKIKAQHIRGTGGGGGTPQAILAFSVESLQQKKPEQHMGQRFDEIVTTLERLRLGKIF